MAPRIYDTLTHSKRPLDPVRPGHVGIYVCGMTVQGEPHVGHARAAVSGDVIHRYLRYAQYQVEYLTNFTDVDDKIIARANEEGVPFSQVAERNIQLFHAMEKALNLLPATRYPRATEHIEEIVQFIEGLIAKEHAYATPEGDVYFDVRSFPGYGELSGRRLEEGRSGTRVDQEANKRDAADFVLWKRARPGEPAWASPWGEGRPGWHIECSVMSTTYLGPTVDIHGGGRDLLFPHHENERAQAEALTGETFVRHWAENGLVTLGGEKMSKSTGNFLTVADLLAQVAGPVVRLYLLQTHYRSPIDFSIEQVRRAESAYARLVNFLRAVEAAGAAGVGAGGGGSEVAGARRAELDAALEGAESAFREAMDDDFNTARALAGAFDLIRKGNALLNAEGERTAAELESLRNAAAMLRTLVVDVLGVVVDTAGAAGAEAGGSGALAGEVGPFVELLVAARDQARQARLWSLADQIRDGLADLGVLLEDRPTGTVWRAVAPEQGD